jgi:hypothetical protein
MLMLVLGMGPILSARTEGVVSLLPGRPANLTISSSSNLDFRDYKKLPDALRQMCAEQGFPQKDAATPVDMDMAADEPVCRSFP